MVWGQAVWGTPWDWQDPRLMSTLVMFFVYLGYIALRNAIDDPTVRARRSAILGAIAVVQVPLVYFSVNLFRTLHQTQSIRPDGSGERHLTSGPEIDSVPLISPNGKYVVFERRSALGGPAGPAVVGGGGAGDEPHSGGVGR